MKISVVINTYNAEEHLERVMESVKDFDEVLICDMHSTDRTQEIAAKYNCRLILHEHTRVVEPARAFAIEAATHEWVLVVDADEYIPAALKDFLYEQIKNENCAVGFRIPRKNYLMGRFMRCAYPDYILRFLKKGKFEWSSTIHTSPKIDGEVYTIPRKRKDLAFVHLANEPISVTLRKMNTYTDFELKRRADRNYGWFTIIFHPFVRFIRYYIMKGGFRDGLPGFIWAIQYSFYKFVTVVKVIESKIKEEDFDDDLKGK